MNNAKKAAAAAPAVTRNRQPVIPEEQERYMKDNQTLSLQVRCMVFVH